MKLTILYWTNLFFILKKGCFFLCLKGCNIIDLFSGWIGVLSFSILRLWLIFYTENIYYKVHLCHSPPLSHFKSVHMNMYIKAWDTRPLLILVSFFQEQEASVIIWRLWQSFLRACANVLLTIREGRQCKNWQFICVWAFPRKPKTKETQNNRKPNKIDNNRRIKIESNTNIFCVGQCSKSSF